MAFYIWKGIKFKTRDEMLDFMKDLGFKEMLSFEVVYSKPAECSKKDCYARPGPKVFPSGEDGISQNDRNEIERFVFSAMVHLALETRNEEMFHSVCRKYSHLLKSKS